MENPKLGKTTGTLGSETNSLFSEYTKVLTASRAYSRDMHIYFKATALDTIFTLPDRINNRKITKNTEQINLLQVDRRVVVTLLGSPDSTSLDLRLYTCNEFSLSITLFSSSHTCFCFLAEALLCFSHTPLLLESLFFQP